MPKLTEDMRQRWERFHGGHATIEEAGRELEKPTVSCWFCEHFNWMLIPGAHVWRCRNCGKPHPVYDGYDVDVYYDEQGEVQTDIEHR